MLWLLPEADLPTHDNPTQIDAGAAWRNSAAGDNQSATAGCKSTANHPLVPIGMHNEHQIIGRIGGQASEH